MTVALYHFCASMRAYVRACLCFKMERLPRYFCCGCAAETITPLSNQRTNGPVNAHLISWPTLVKHKTYKT